jgi:hypothetical protein
MISQTQQVAISAAGIRIIPCICGSMEEVIAAFLENRVECSELRMPGCGGSKKKIRKSHCKSGKDQYREKT